jgi:hypothetical protein
LGRRGVGRRGKAWQNRDKGRQDGETVDWLQGTREDRRRVVMVEWRGAGRILID